MNDSPDVRPASVPNIYFIDDSATMREVVKISLRRENFNVVTCADVASAVEQFTGTRPDAIISDVIMPDKDGYQLCEYVRQHRELAATPVILLSGVINRDVAEKAQHACADELMRKPFHPQELVACVKKLLKRSTPETDSVLAPGSATKVAPGAVNPLSQLFGVPVPTLSEKVLLSEASLPVAGPMRKGLASATPTAPTSEITRLRAEVRRLESLAKKLQAQLDTEREYCVSLESQLRTFSATE
jgi:DNA-binding response OmpR family regulator